jgi:hypothetical protein
MRIAVLLLALAVSCDCFGQTPAPAPAKAAPAATMTPPLSAEEMKPFLQSVIAMSTAQNKELAAETDAYRQAKVEFQSALDFYNRTVNALRKAHDIPATCFPDVDTSTWLQAKPDGTGAMACVVTAPAKATVKVEKK